MKLPPDTHLLEADELLYDFLGRAKGGISVGNTDNPEVIIGVTMPPKE